MFKNTQNPMRQWPFAAVLVLMSFAFSTTVFADLIGYSYTATSGAQTQSPASESFINPQSGITLYLSSGIDRRINVSIQDGAGAIVFEARSELLGANDRFVYEGRSFYGFSVQAPKLADGHYQVTSRILANGGGIVREDTHDVTVDTTPPEATGAINRVGRGWPAEVLTPNGYADRELRLEGVSDGSSGLKEARFFAVDDQGNERTTDANLDPVEGIASVDVSQAAKSSMMPKDQSYYTIGFRISDVAGNTQDVTMESAVDRVVPGVDIEVLNDPSGVWKPYVSGMTVYENPVRVRYVRKKSEHTAYNGSDFGWIGGSINAEDSVNVYDHRTIKYPQTYSYFVYQTKAGGYRNYRYRSFNFTLGGDATMGPKPAGLTYHLQGDGWKSGDRPRYGFPYVVDKVRLSAQARPYDQKAWLRGFSHCVIPAGATSCEANVSVSRSSGRGYSPIQYYISKMDGSFVNHGGYLYTYWDMNPPTIESLSVDEREGRVSARVYDGDRVNTWQVNHWDTKTFKAFAEINGNRIELDRVAYEEADYRTKLVEFDLKSAPDGTYTVTVEATDTYGNTASKALGQTVTVDTTSPALTISAGATIQSLDQILISISDEPGKGSRLESIRLNGGPASDDVQLSWREESSGQFRLEYPVMFPSMTPDETYTLSVIAQDRFDNEITEEAEFEYKPRTVGIIGDDGDGLKLPAVNHTFKRPDGLEVIATESLTLNDGSVVSGVYDVFATLRSDSDMALVVNGVRLEPGATQRVLPAHNFGANAGKINIPLSIAEYRVEGKASLLLSTTAPNAPIILAQIESWTPGVRFEAEAWSVFPALDEASITLANGQGYCAGLTSSKDSARYDGHPLNSPVCLVEWNHYPRELYETAIEEVPSLRGFTSNVGVNPVEAQIYIVTPDGSEVLLQTIQHDLEVKLPDGSIQTRLDPAVDTLERLIERVEFTVEQTGGPNCSVFTTDEAFALDTASLGRPSCLLTWVEVPDGLSPDGSKADTPSLAGIVNDGTSESETLSWTVDAFTPAGTKVNMGQYSKTLDIIDPPAPVIEVDEEFLLEDSLYASPIMGGYLGDYYVEARGSDLELDTFLEGKEMSAELIDYYWGDGVNVRRRMISPEGSLWETQKFEIKARYSKLPRVETVKVMNLLTVPDDSLRPTVVPDREVALNTDSLGVTIAIENPYETEAAFEKASMGDWNVRLVNMRSLSDLEPLTEFKNIDDAGEAGFDLDLLELETQGFRLMAEAKLVSPVDSYQRTVLSPRPAYITVLRGEAIESSVEARRLVGEAPLMVMASLALEQRLDYESMGEVVWQQRTDEGAWSDLESDSFGSRIIRSYDAGQYELRAKVRNRHSGAMYTTESVKVMAFNVPEVEISGPSNNFVSDTGRYELEARLKGEPLTAEDVAVEWSEDYGETWTPGGLTYEVTRDERARVSFMARVRMAESPNGFEDVWVQDRERVSFREIEPPRIGIFGPRLVEIEKEQEWRGALSTPYRDMNVNLKGEFILPDGSTVQGEQLLYIPSKDALEVGYIYLKYRAWIEGFEDRGAEAVYERRIRIWEYEWPDWSFYVRQDAHQAPAEVYVRIRSPGRSTRYIEGLTFEWSLPDGSKVIEDRYEDGRLLQFEEPGYYPVTVRITDERGHESVITHDVMLAEQDPWDVNFSYRSSNEYERAPLTLSFRPDVDGGHPRDRVRVLRYYKDGEMVTEDQRYGEVVLDEGTHTVALEIESEFGHKVMSEQTLRVNPNQKPTCDLDTRDMSAGWRFYARCEDVDGDIEDHRWIVDGENVGISGSRISVTSRDGAIPTVKLVGIDDSRAESPPVYW